MKRIITILLGIIIGAFLIAGVAFAIHQHNLKAQGNGATADADDATPVPVAATSTPTNDPLSDLKLSLTVDLDRETLEGMYAGFSREFLDSSMPNRNLERTSAASKVGWGKEGNRMYDAVTFPFSTVEKGKKEYSSEDIDIMYAELQEEIMRNPVMGDMVLQGMAYMKLTDNTSIADLNVSWAEDFETMYDQYGISAFVTYHTRYWEKYGFELPHDGESVEEWKAEHPDAPNPTEEDCELIPMEEDESPTPSNSGAYGRTGVTAATNQVKYKLFVTDYYVRTAKRILTWLDRCAIQGVETYSTARHWPLNSALDANQVRTYMNQDASYKDNQPALIFSVMTKDGNKQLLFGFNVYDMRLEIFERTSTPVAPDPDPTPRRSPDPTPTQVTPDPDPKPDPDPTPTPVPDPDPDPDPKKDPKKDPVHNGNANTGGGEGRGDTPDDPVPDPSQDDMGNDPDNGGHTNPSEVTPTPPPGQDDTDNTDSNPDDYGEEDHNQDDPVEDDDGNESNPGDQDPGDEFDEPPV